MKDISVVNQGLQIPIAKRLLNKIDNSFFYITNEFLKKGAKNNYYIKNPPENVICKKEDVLMTRTGNTGKVVTNVAGAFHNNFFKIDFDRKVLLKDYLVTFLTHDNTQHRILVLAGNSTIPDLNHSDFYRLEIPIPPLPEQKAIADCLSTWDKAIENQSLLIEAKKEFKKGLMQGFFNGQLTMNNGQLVKAKEGEDFTEDWEALKIKDIGYIPKKEPVESLGNLKTLTVRLYTKGIDFNENAKTVISSTGRPYYQRYKNEILIGRQNIHNGGIGEVQEIHDGHICSNAISSFVINEDNDKDFILAVLMYPEIYKRFEVYMTGTGQKELSERQLLKLEIKVPTIKIQNSISRFLQSVDKEIELLEQKLSALQEQKKGLMQVLLTGEKRLV